ncbi:MAG: DegT/DnrJ/EryC1/StrS family aminotransferase [Deltaproteobacteria bacterium]|nr:DegT/DnrJ/EryC1/StrS family aminotransferase [Deltaproteobacteria bacterium]
MNVPLLDLSQQYQTIKEEVLSVTAEIFESQRFILGQQVVSLEEKIAAYCGVKDAVGVSSGTDALLIALMAADVGSGDLVITSPYSFFATAGTVVRAGARPVFADIDPETYNITRQSIESSFEKLSPEDKKRVKAIIPVHLYGQCAQMDPILEFAQSLGLVVIEDAAQAIGAQYKGARAGAMGDYGCFSFYPTKNLGAFGDGGMVTVNDSKLSEKLKHLRDHGSHPKYYHQIVGGNFRLDAIQAAVVQIKLKYLDDWTRSRQENAHKYRQFFEQAGLSGRVGLPIEREERHIYNQFIIRVDDSHRDSLCEFLSEAQIGTEIYYPLPLHLQKCFSNLGCIKGDFPESESAARQTLALPVYPELAEDQLAYVVEKIKAFYS